MKNVLFSLFAIFEKRKSNLQKLFFRLCNLLIDNVSKKCRFIKLIWQIIRIKCHFIPIICQNILAIRLLPKILPLKNVLFSLSPFLVFHFKLLFESNNVALQTSSPNLMSDDFISCTNYSNDYTNHSNNYTNRFNEYTNYFNDFTTY